VNRVARQFHMVSEPTAFNKLSNEAWVDSLDDDDFMSLVEEVMYENDDDSGMVVAIKGAALKKAAKRRADIAEDENTTNFLNDIIEQINEARGNNTPAARTLQTHTVDEPSVRDCLPDTFKQSGLLPAQAQPNVVDTTASTTQLPTDDTAIRMKDYDTRASLPAEFASINKYEDQSFVAQAGRMKSSTAAEKSVALPKPTFKDQEDETQLPRYWTREKNTTTVANQAADTYKPASKPKTTQKQYDVNLGGLMSNRPDGT
jgi:hypothetical protein